MKTIILNLYAFSELSAAVQQKVLADLIDINIDGQWWDSVYEDAANIGLKITSFDMDSEEITADYIFPSAPEVAEAILKEHGKKTDTYRVAKHFLDEIEGIRNEHEKVEDTDEDAIERAEDWFKAGLMRAYLKILKQDYDYRTGVEAVKETIEANEYMFEQNGKIKNTPVETRVYVVDPQQTDVASIKLRNMYDDEFMTEAEKQGTVYTLEKYQEESLGLKGYTLVRFITKD